MADTSNPLLDPSLDPSGLKEPKGPPPKAGPAPNVDYGNLSQALGLGGMKQTLSEDRQDLDLKAANLSVPHLTKPPPQQVPTDPLQAFGQPAMWIAMFGSLLTRAHLTTAVQAAAGVMKATHDQDLALAKQQYDQWKVESENAVKMAKFEQDAYKNAINRYRADATTGEAEVKVLNTAFHNAALEHVYASEGMDGVVKYLGKKGTDTVLLQERALTLSDKMQDHIDKMQARQDWQDAHPNATPQERNAAMFAIDKGQDPDAGKGAGANWQIGTDTASGKQMSYRIKPDGTVEAKDMNGNPYTPGGIASKPSGSASQGALSKEDAHNVALMYVGGNKSALIGLSRNPANMKMVADEVTQILKDQNKTPADINAAMIAFDQATAGARTMGSIQARTQVGANELDTLIPQAREASAQVWRLGSVPVDKLIQALQGASDDPDLADFSAVNQSVANAFAGIANRGGQPTEGAREHAYALLSTVRDQASYNRILDRLEKESQGFQRAITKTGEQIQSGVRGGGRQWAHSATGPNGSKIYSDDGAHWFTSDGKPFGE